MAETPPLPYDIIEPTMPPTPPADYGWLLWLGATLLLLLMAGTFLHWRRTRHRRHARTQLLRARRAFRAGSLHAQEAAYAIAGALRTAWSTSHLAAADTSPARWQSFVAKLDAARYRAPDPAADLEALFAEAAYWLGEESPC